MLQSALKLHLWALILLISVDISASTRRSASIAHANNGTTTSTPVLIVKKAEGNVTSTEAPSTSADEESDANQDKVVDDTSDYLDDENDDDDEKPKVKHHHHVHVHPKDSKTTTRKPKDCDKKSSTITPYPVIKEELRKRPVSSSNTTVEPKGLASKLLHDKNLTSSHTGVDLKKETTEAAKVMIQTTTQLPSGESKSAVLDGMRHDEEDEDEQTDDQDEQESNEDYTEEGEYRNQFESCKNTTKLGQEVVKPVHESISDVISDVNANQNNLTFVSSSSGKPKKKRPSRKIKSLTNKIIKSKSPK